MGTEVEGVSLYTGNFLTMVDVGSKTASSKLLRQQLGFFICGWFCFVVVFSDQDWLSHALLDVS